MDNYGHLGMEEINGQCVLNYKIEIGGLGSGKLGR